MKATDGKTQTPSPVSSFCKAHDEGVGMAEVWENIKADFEGSSTSVRALELKYGINRNKINKKRKEEKWTKYVPMVKRANNQTAQIAPHTAMLGKTALRKIEEVKEELGDHYSPVDEPLIVVFAKNYERYIDLEQTLAVEGVTVTSMKTGGSYLNPTFTALQAVQKTLLTYANQLGLSMISRKQLGIKLGNDKKSDQSIFDFVDDINNMEVKI